jgi:hypothetical protein
MIFNYTHLNPTATLDTDSPEFLAKLAYLLRYSTADSYAVVPGVNVSPLAGPDGNVVVGQLSITQTCSVIFREGTAEVTIDAYLISIRPEDALPEITRTLGLAKVDPIPQFADEATPSRNPVGEPWPAKGSNVFRVSSSFDADPMSWPEGSFHEGRRDGRKAVWRRIRVMIAPGGLITPGVYHPAWQLAEWQ